MANPESTSQQTLTAAAKAGPTRTPAPQDGALIRAPLTALVDNPYQPRASVDAVALEELVAGIRSQGLLQPIAVRPQPGGDFVIVAGHRRVAAYRHLHANSQTEAERQRYASIPAVVMLGLNNAQLAARAYQENVARAALNPVEEAVVLERMLGEGLASSVEELSTLMGQPPARIKRLRRLAAAPRVVKDALAKGVMVVTGQGEDGKERRELRRLDLLTALAFQRLWEHLRKAAPKRADEQVDGLVRRSLARNWSKKRVEEHVEGVIGGRESADEDDAAVDAEVALFTRTARRFVVEFPRNARATSAQLESLKAAFATVLGELASGPVVAGH